MRFGLDEFELYGVFIKLKQAEFLFRLLSKTVGDIRFQGEGCCGLFCEAIFLIMKACIDERAELFSVQTIALRYSGFEGWMQGGRNLERHWFLTSGKRQPGFDFLIKA